MNKGLAECDKCDYFISVEEAYQQGAKDFTEWLCEKSAFETIESKGMWGRDIRGKQKYYPIDAVFSEWQNETNK